MGQSTDGILAYGYDTVQGRMRHFVLVPVAAH